MPNSSVTETAMVEKIQRLERQVASLEVDLVNARAASLDTLLGPLRLRQAALVYFGVETTTAFVDDLTKTFGSDASRSIARHLFVLNHAPMLVSQIDAVRTAFAGGNCTW